MKKILAIGDSHGLDVVDTIKEGLKNFYDIIFLGDAVDSFFVPASEQLYNLNNLCTIARENKDHVTLLLGNHCYAYLYGISGISGYQYYKAHEYKKIFQDNEDLFQIAWGYRDEKGKYTLATHAGLTHNYYKFFLEDEIKEGEEIHDTLNRLKNMQSHMWVVGRARGGRSNAPGPLWADYTEVIENRYEGINQIFGHTPQVTPRIDHIGDDFLACIDDRGNKKVVSMLFTL